MGGYGRPTTDTAEFLRPYLEDYQELAAMFQVARAAFEYHVPVEKSFLRKTAELVSEYTASGGIAPPEEPVEITPEALAAIAASQDSEVVRVVNLVKALHRAAEEQAREAPYLISIGERAEEIAQRFYDRQSTTHEALEALEQLVARYREAEQERKDADLSMEAFTVHRSLALVNVPDSKVIGKAVEAVFVAHPHWRQSDKQEQQVRLVLHRYEP